MESSVIKMYGTTWCGDCKRARRVFEETKIDYQFIDIDKDKAAEEFVRTTNHGNRSVPTIVFPDGEILVEPSSLSLLEKFAQLGKTGDKIDPG